MTARVLEGEPLARDIAARAAAKAAEVRKLRGFPPVLAVLSVGGDPASKLYRKRQVKSCAGAGIEARIVRLPELSTEAPVAAALEELSRDERVDAILVESPLPPPLSLRRVLAGLPFAKDVEGLGPSSAGRLYSCKTMAEVEVSGAFVPATAAAVIEILKASACPIAGAEAVVLGRSSVVGRPAAHLLSCLDSTVTLCHSRTRGLEAHLRRADIVVAAAGRPGLVRGRDLKPGAVVVDAGVTVEGNKARGDVDFESAARVAAAVSPVPGGVGPVTAALLLLNVTTAASRRLGGPA